MPLALVVIVAASLDVSAVANPRASDAWVSDGAGMISESDEARLNELGDALQKSVGLQLAIVTVEAVDGPVRPFAVKLFNHWGVGDAAHDNGLMFFVSRKERALESVTGDGIAEVLTAAWLKQMQDATIIPHFKKGSPGAGLVAGVERVQAFLSGEAAGEGEAYAAATVAAPQPAVGSPKAPARRPAPSPESSSEEREVPWVPLGTGGVVLFGLGGAGLWWRRKKWRTCVTCKGPNVLLDEATDDSYLDAGQRREEQIGSVDYDVFHCGSCEHAIIRRKGRWFSGYKKCPECRYKARTVKTTTVSAATYSSSGSMRVDENCAHCGFSRTSYRTIPMKVASSSSSSSSSSGSSFGSSSSSSSSSSGSSYGGGSSSGGGASSSW